MKTSRRRLATAIVGALLASSAGADDVVRLHPGMGGVADIGATKCDYYTFVHPNAPRGFHQSVVYYVEGYVLARTGQTINVWLASLPGGRRWTFDAIGNHVLDWCAANPTGNVADGVNDLWAQMSGG